MSKQLNIRLPEAISKELDIIAAEKGMTVSKFVAEAIMFAIEVEKNMSPERQSRVVIENAKNTPDNYKLLLKSA
jgi:metal-responsive CopG/Arc/MetJ family transcriptional regulator